MKNIILSFIFVFIIVGKNNAGEEKTGFEFTGLVSTSVWDKYLLFNVPVAISDQPSMQNLLLINLPGGLTASIWQAEDLSNSTAGDEIDLDISWSKQISEFNFTTGIGTWNINPTHSKFDDILTGYVSIGGAVSCLEEVNWEIKVRYYHTDFLGDGFQPTLNLNKSFEISDRVTLAVNPFLTYDDGFGVTPGLYVGTNTTINIEINEKTTLFFTGRAIAGQGIEDAGGGVGVSVKF